MLMTYLHLVDYTLLIQANADIILYRLFLQYQIVLPSILYHGITTFFVYHKFYILIIVALLMSTLNAFSICSYSYSCVLIV